MSQKKNKKPQKNQLLPSDFFQNDEEKTKLNWFCFEFAAELDLYLGKELKSEFKKAHIPRTKVIKFCIQYAKSLKPQILDVLAGDIPSVQILHTDIENFFPEASDDLIDDILTIAAAAWNFMADACAECEVNCLQEKDAYAPMFDDPEYDQ